MNIFRKILIYFLVAVLFLVIGFFLASIFTYPNGAVSAIKNLDQATKLMFYKVVGSDNVEELEREIAQYTNWQPAPGELDALYPNENYPYSASLPPEAEGKIELIYNWEISQNTLTIKMKTNNIGNVKNKELRDLYVSILYKDIDGNEIEVPDQNLLGNFGIWQYQNDYPQEPRMGTGQYDSLPKDFLDKVFCVELTVY